LVAARHSPPSSISITNLPVQIPHALTASNRLRRNMNRYTLVKDDAGDTQAIVARQPLYCPACDTADF